MDETNTGKHKEKLDAIHAQSEILRELLAGVDLSTSKSGRIEYWKRDKFLPALKSLIEITDEKNRDKIAPDHLTGAPRKEVAAAVTDQAAWIFKQLSGRPPTVITPALGGNAHSEFLTFLKKIFDILEIEASPESQAKKWLKATKALR